MSTSTNWEWHKRAQNCIAQGALTNSKRPECLILGVYPTHLKRGQGCYVWDDRDRRYIDFICGLGSNLLGYAHTEVNSSIIDQSHRGASLSLSTTLEIQVAEKVKEIFPFIDLMKFLKTGSDACTAAIRIARAKTGRRTVLSEGYHGWHDEFISSTPPALGVASASYMFEKFQSIELIDRRVAAVIIEPVMTDASEARAAWLHALRKRCTETGTLLIFDEVITGFRFPKYSVSNDFGVIPDLICLGKAMGNGMPIALVGGKKDVMNCGEYFVSSTFAGETLSLAAALKTMTLLQVKYLNPELWEKGGYFLKRFNALWPEEIRIEGYPTRGVFQGNKEIKDLFFQEACKAGLLFGPSWFFCYPHIDVIDGVLSTCQDIMIRIKTGSVKLEGEPSSSPFAQKMRETK